MSPTANMNRANLIKEMYTKISKVYNGEMGFEEETANILNGASVFNSSPICTDGAYAKFEEGFAFWDWVSPNGKHIRYEYSVFTPKVEAQKDQRVSVMERNFIRFLNPAHDYFSSTYPNIAQMFGEIGAKNADGQSLGPAYYDIPHNRRVLDEQERADYFLAALKGSKALEIMTINVWGVISDNYSSR